MYYPVSALLIEFLILSIVDTQDSYGYEISQTVKIVADIKEAGKGWIRYDLFAGIPGT